MFKKVRGPQIVRAMLAANAAIADGKFDDAGPHIERAHDLFLEGPLPLAMHENMIVEWNQTALDLQQRGREDLAAQCFAIAQAFHARVDAGETTDLLP